MFSRGRLVVVCLGIFVGLVLVTAFGFGLVLSVAASASVYGFFAACGIVAGLYICFFYLRILWKSFGDMNMRFRIYALVGLVACFAIVWSVRFIVSPMYVVSHGYGASYRQALVPHHFYNVELDDYVLIKSQEGFQFVRIMQNVFDGKMLEPPRPNLDVSKVILEEGDRYIVRKVYSDEDPWAIPEAEITARVIGL